MSEVLHVHRDAGVVTVTLHRPQRKNALNRELLDALLSTFHEIAHRPDDRAVVVTGGDSFCSGADLAGRSKDSHPLDGSALPATTRAAIVRPASRRFVMTTYRSVPAPGQMERSEDGSRSSRIS